MMTTSESDHLLLLAQLPRWERVVLAARCARVAVRLLDSLSLPVGLKQIAALEEVVRLAEESAARCAYLFELQPAMEKLKHLAFDVETECKYRSDSVVCQAVRATHAAGMAAFAGSSIDAQDALRAAFAAARTAESSAAEELLSQEVRRAQRSAVEAAALRMRNGAGMMQADRAVS